MSAKPSGPLSLRPAAEPVDTDNQSLVEPVHLVQLAWIRPCRFERHEHPIPHPDDITQLDLGLFVFRPSAFEDRTGLTPASSGRCLLPPEMAAFPALPVHVRIKQRLDRVEIPGEVALIGDTQRLGVVSLILAHYASVCPSVRPLAPAAPRRRGRRDQLEMLCPARLITEDVPKLVPRRRLDHVEVVDLARLTVEDAVEVP